MYKSLACHISITTLVLGYLSSFRCCDRLQLQEEKTGSKTCYRPSRTFHESTFVTYKSYQRVVPVKQSTPVVTLAHNVEIAHCWRLQR